MPLSTTSPRVPSDLQRRRLEQRARRIERVLEALRDRSIQRAAEGPVPAPLGHAIAGFSIELRRLRSELE